ncbi:hypothetical protein Tco_1313316 [Tanacetum coccineum]
MAHKNPANYKSPRAKRTILAPKVSPQRRSLHFRNVWDETCNLAKFQAFVVVVVALWIVAVCGGVAAVPKTIRVLITCRSRQLEVEGDGNENVPLYYDITDKFRNNLGERKFLAVITGLRGSTILEIIEDDVFDRIHDQDAVSQLLENDRVGWDNFPWGSFVWPTLYSQLKNANVKRWPKLYASQDTTEIDKKAYSIFGYTWAFNTWILESFRVTATNYYYRHNLYPIVAAWKKKRGSLGEAWFMIFFMEICLAKRFTPITDENRGSEAEDWWISKKGHTIDGGVHRVVPLHSRRIQIAAPSSILNILNRRKREQRPSYYKQYPYMEQPPTTILPKQHGNKKKNNVTKTNLSPLNLGNAFADENVGGDDVVFLGGRFTVPVTFWQQLVPHLCPPDYDSGTPMGWLSGEHMNAWVELLIRYRTNNDPWTVAYTNTISVHPENQRFMIETDQHTIGTLDGSSVRVSAIKPVAGKNHGLQIVAGNQSNGSAGTKAYDNAVKARVEIVPKKDYILLPLWTQNSRFSSSLKDSPDAGFKPSGEEEKKKVEDLENEDSEVQNTEEPRVNQEKDKNVNSTNNINIVSSTVNTASIKDKVVDENIVYGCANDLNMPNLEEIIYSDDEDSVEADMTNLDIHIPVSPIPTTIIYKDHPVEQIIKDIHSTPQTKRMTKSVTNHGIVGNKRILNCYYCWFKLQLLVVVLLLLKIKENNLSHYYCWSNISTASTTITTARIVSTVRLSYHC